jgi:hypothetical protein
MTDVALKLRDSELVVCDHDDPAVATILLRGRNQDRGIPCVRLRKPD